MLNGEVIVATLKDLVKKADGTDKKLGLKEVAETAHRRMICGGDFPAEAVCHALVVGLMSKKPRLSETCCSCLHHILQINAIPPRLTFSHTEDKEPVIVSVAMALCETLMAVPDGSVQLKALDCVALCAADAKYTALTGGHLTKVLQTCFNLSLTSVNTAVQINSSGVLRTIAVQRIVKLFIDRARPEEDPSSFACGTPVDVTVDVEPTDPFKELDIDYVAEDLTPEDPRNINDLPHHARDFCLLFRTLCTLAITPIPSDASSVQVIEVKTRLAALKLLRLLLEELPAANCPSESSASAEVRRAMSIVKLDLWRAVTRNVATIMPPQLFQIAVEIITEVSIKAHFFVHAELHLLFVTVLLPLAQSQFTTFQQKLCVLRMVRKLLSKPTVALALFINYDCNPRFEESGRYGGLVEVLLTFVTELCHLNFVEKDWFTEDQASLLRTECVKVMRQFTMGLRTFISEDPNDGSDEDIPDHLARSGSFAMHRFATSIRAHSEPGSLGDDVETSSRSNGAGASAASSFYRSSTPYHWKHIHHMLANKRILEAAVQRFNTNWRHGRTFLIDRGVIPENDDVMFASFLRNHPAVEKSQLRKIFEKVLKDEECLVVLRAFLSTFDYHGVPLDVALRETTLEFMDWAAPNFEAPVWGKIQESFGEEYAKQNSDTDTSPECKLSARDADALAGVLLFLHTSLHNKSAAAARMKEADFVSYGGQCLETTLPEDAMIAIYRRMEERKWEPDRKLAKFSGLGRELPKAMGTPATASSGSIGTMQSSGNFSAEGSVELQIGAQSEGELLDGNMKTYSDNWHNLPLSQQHQLNFIRVANEHLRVFEAELQNLYGKRRYAMPFVPPQYAQHVRPVLLSFYPHIGSVLYAGLRLVHHEPLLDMIDEVNETILDLASAFVINLTDMYAALEKMTQRCLRQDGAVSFGAVAPSLSAFLVNRI